MEPQDADARRTPSLVGQPGPGELRVEVVENQNRLLIVGRRFASWRGVMLGAVIVLIGWRSIATNSVLPVALMGAAVLVVALVSTRWLTRRQASGLPPDSLLVCFVRSDRSIGWAGPVDDVLTAGCVLAQVPVEGLVVYPNRPRLVGGLILRGHGLGVVVYCDRQGRVTAATLVSDAGSQPINGSGRIPISILRQLLIS